MMIHEITEKVGRRKRGKRIGRGPSSAKGKTAGRGHKGARSRSGWSGSVPPGFEGGQMPFFRRVPKRGFSNARFTQRYAVVNVKALDARFGEGAEVDFDALRRSGLVGSSRLPVKVLGDGELNKPLTVKAAVFSRKAREKIEGAGGRCEGVAEK